MSLIDISVPLSETLPAFPGDPEIRLDRAGVVANPFHLTRLSLGSHAGTHIDAPAHLIGEGATVDAIPLEWLIGPCRVVDLRGRKRAIGAVDLKPLPLAGVRRLLLRTDNSELWHRPGFCEDYVGLAPDAANYLIELGIRLVGIDYLSIEPPGEASTVHRILLGAEVVILEGLNLAESTAGDYELLCLPLKLIRVDGAPCRAVLRPLAC